jgi:hypothetical protein
MQIIVDPIGFSSATTAHVHLGLHVIDHTIMETSHSMQFIKSYWSLRLPIGYMFCNLQADFRLPFPHFTFQADVFRFWTGFH